MGEKNLMPLVSLVSGTPLVLLCEVTAWAMVVFNLMGEKLRLRGGDIARWKSVCLACTRPRVCSPGLKKEKREIRGKEGRKREGKREGREGGNPVRLREIKRHTQSE